MKPLRSVIGSAMGAAAMLATISLPSAGQQGERPAIPAIQAQYDRFNASLKGRNIAALASLCTADCKFQTRPDGPALSLDQFRQATTEKFRSMTVQRARTHVDSVHIDDGTAHVKATWTGDLLSVSADKKKRHIRSVQKLDDTWARKPEGWLLQSSRVASVQTTVDGKSSRE